MWLKNKLRLFYPNIYIPALPKIKLIVNKNENKLNKSLYYLQSFIDELIRNDLIRSSDLFFNFITLSLENFNKEKTIVEKLDPPKGLYDITTIDGIIRIDIVPSVDKRAFEIKNDFNKKSQLYKKLSFHLKDLMKQMEIMNQKYLQLSEIFDELNNLYFSSKVIIKDKMTENFIKLKEIFKSYSEGYLNQKNFFNNEVKNYFNYIKKELQQFEPIYNTYNEARTTYVDITDKRNYEINETFIGLERYFGYTLNVTIREYEKLHYNHYIRTKQHFMELQELKEGYISSYKNFIKLITFK